MAVLQIVRFRAKPEVSDAEMLQVNERFQREVAPNLPGLERREATRTDTGDWVLVLRYADMDQEDRHGHALGLVPSGRLRIGTAVPVTGFRLRRGAPTESGRVEAFSDGVFAVAMIAWPSSGPPCLLSAAPSPSWGSPGRTTTTFSRG